jgi:hypothetical protein
MLRIKVWSLAAILCIAANGLGICQAPHPGFPGMYPGNNPCKFQPREEPVSRTVEVPVPVPAPPISCAPHPCAPYPPCGVACPPPPTQPVKVRVEVVVRPEEPKPCPQPTIQCGNPPVFEPVFFHAAAMVRSALLIPLGLGETILGHPCPPYPPAPYNAAGPWMRRPCFQPRPAPQCAAPYPPVVKCAPPAPCGPPHPGLRPFR